MGEALIQSLALQIPNKQTNKQTKKQQRRKEGRERESKKKKKKREKKNLLWRLSSGHTCFHPHLSRGEATGPPFLD
jgi:hypothetical protein